MLTDTSVNDCSYDEENKKVVLKLNTGKEVIQEFLDISKITEMYISYANLASRRETFCHCCIFMCNKY